MKKNGFTLSEIVVATAIVGVLAVVLVPAVFNAKPNQELLMFRKAYYLTERMVSELVNDEDLYPELDDTDAAQFFGNTEKVKYKGKNYGGKAADAAKKKFCELMAAKLNSSSDVSCTEIKLDKMDGTETSGSMTTSDGIVWIFPVTTFADSSAAYPIYVDVNGDKGPNCLYDKEKCLKPDRFTINVYQDGRVEANGTIEHEYLTKKDIGNKAEPESSQARIDAGYDKAKDTTKDDSTKK